MIPWLREDNLANNIAVVDNISALAEKKGVTTAQLTLAWLLAQGDGIFPIPGTKKASRLEENLASMHITLTAEEEMAFRKAAEGVVGGRVQDLLGYTFADTPPLLIRHLCSSGVIGWTANCAPNHWLQRSCTSKLVGRSLPLRGIIIISRQYRGVSRDADTSMVRNRNL